MLNSIYNDLRLSDYSYWFLLRLSNEKNRPIVSCLFSVQVMLEKTSLRATQMGLAQMRFAWWRDVLLGRQAGAMSTLGVELYAIVKANPSLGDAFIHLIDVWEDAFLINEKSYEKAYEQLNKMLWMITAPHADIKKGESFYKSLAHAWYLSRFGDKEDLIAFLCKNKQLFYNSNKILMCKGPLAPLWGQYFLAFARIKDIVKYNDKSRGPVGLSHNWRPHWCIILKIYRHQIFNVRHDDK